MWNQSTWLLIFQIVYPIIVLLVCIRIVYDTRSVSKTLAYLLLTIFFPIVGIVFYFSFGINYRKRKMYLRKWIIDVELKQAFVEKRKLYRQELEHNYPIVLKEYEGMIRMLSDKRMGSDIMLPNDSLEVLVNGESFFPKLMDALLKAKSHIHIEFYIFEDDYIGNSIKEILIQKAYAGVEVRFIYDDFGSMSIRRGFVNDMIQHGIQAYPFNEIKLVKLANRLNYRNHRKIVVIDGYTSFVGGINISDKYDNTLNDGKYWRDTHLMIEGYASQALQRVFLSDWNFCSEEDLVWNKKYFPDIESISKAENFVQIVSSGPDSDMPTILYALIQAIRSAKKEILITTPYYIPEAILQEMLTIISLSGVDVKLLVPKKGDSNIVTIASHSFYKELLLAGVRIFEYTKGFVHAKTFVIDRKISSIGTANLDARSFELNFEVVAIIYGEGVAEELSNQFYKDLEDAEEVLLDNWKKRSRGRRLFEKIVRLVSPFL